jgi:hypothetical protein
MRGVQVGGGVGWGGGGGCVDVTEEREVNYGGIDCGGGRLGGGGGGWGGGLTAEERDALLKLPRREHILTKEEKRRALIGLVNIQ